MSSNHYKLYLDSVLQLAKTIVIKSEYSAQKINEYVDYAQGEGSYDPFDKRTWKYYLNLAGEYHSSDDVLVISSLDTLDYVNFSKEVLEQHPVTKDAYKHNSRYYRELVYLHPEYETLILGVLNPVDIDEAIAAKDFTVLAYPPELIESNEYSLVANINKWLENFNIRWNNEQFNISDDLFGTALLGVMAAQLVPLILNLRLRACHTVEAHSFHVKEYLASHGMLDKYLQAMTHEQAMFFYRNINYIERNSGKQDTFDWLVDNILSKRNLPISEYVMRHDTTHLAETLVPEITFKKSLLNTNQANNAQSDTKYGIDIVLHKEELLAPDNERYSRENTQLMQEQFEKSLSATLSTKVLESSVVNYQDAVPFTLHEVYIANWINYTATHAFENFYVRVISPKTNKEIVIQIDDAYPYYLYAIAKSAGVNLEYFPVSLARLVKKPTLPTLEECREIVSPDVVSDEEILALMDTVATEVNINNILDFRANCNNLFAALMEQLYTVYKTESLTKRAQMQALVYFLYEDHYHLPEDVFVSIEAWLDNREYEYKDYTPSDWIDLSKSIYEAVTGIDMSNINNSVAAQKAMISLFTQLSSYSIQVANDVNEYTINSPYFNSVRIEQVGSMGTLYSKILLGFYRVFEMVSYPSDYGFIEVENLLKDFVIVNPPMDLGMLVFDQPQETEFMPFNVDVINGGSFRLNQDNLPLSADASSYNAFSNYQAFNAMTQEQLSQIWDAYSNCHPPAIAPTAVDILDLIENYRVPAAKYVYPQNYLYRDFEYQYIPKSTINFVIMGSETELDAFHDNSGEDLLPTFKANKGFEKLELFKYFTDIPEQMEFPQFYNTAGWTYVSVFSPLKEGDSEVEFNGIKYTGVTYELPSITHNNDVIEIGGLVNALRPIETTISIFSKFKELPDLARFDMTDVQISSITYMSTSGELAMKTVVSNTELGSLDYEPSVATELASFTFHYQSVNLFSWSALPINSALTDLRNAASNVTIYDIGFTYETEMDSIIYRGGTDIPSIGTFDIGTGFTWEGD